MADQLQKGMALVMVYNARLDSSEAPKEGLELLITSSGQVSENIEQSLEIHTSLHRQTMSY